MEHVLMLYFESLCEYMELKHFNVMSYLELEVLYCTLEFSLRPYLVLLPQEYNNYILIKLKI